MGGRVDQTTVPLVLTDHRKRIRALEALTPSGITFGTWQSYTPAVQNNGSDLTDPTVIGRFVEFGSDENQTCLGYIKITLGSDIGTGGDNYEVTLPHLTHSGIIGGGRSVDEETLTLYSSYLLGLNSSFHAVILTPGTDPDSSPSFANAIREGWPWNLTEGDILFEGNFTIDIAGGL